MDISIKSFNLIIERENLIIEREKFNISEFSYLLKEKGYIILLNGDTVEIKDQLDSNKDNILYLILNKNQLCDLELKINKFEYKNINITYYLISFLKNLIYEKKNIILKIDSFELILDHNLSLNIIVKENYNKNKSTILKEINYSFDNDSDLIYNLKILFEKELNIKLVDLNNTTNINPITNSLFFITTSSRISKNL